MIRALLTALAVLTAATLAAFAFAPVAVAPQAEITVAHRAGNVRFASTHGPNTAPVWQPGRSTLLVFGYAACGDVCPRTLAAVSAALAPLQLVPAPRIAFLDVDANDRPATIARFVRRFPGVEGLWGAPDDVRATAAHVGAIASGDLGRHETRVFVIDDEGIVLAVIPPDLAVPALRRRLASVLAASARTEQ